jgi:CrcB protein
LAIIFSAGMVKLLFLMTGGALGTLARYLASGLAHRMTVSLFPVGTLMVNAAGSLLIGEVRVIKYRHSKAD